MVVAGHLLLDKTARLGGQIATRWRKLCLVRIAGLCLLLISALHASAFAGNQKRAEAEALFAHANALIGLGQPTSGPYVIRGHFRLMLPQPLEGTIVKVVLRELDVWRREINLPGYSEIEVRNGDSTWVRRNAEFTPLRVRELITALQPHFGLNKKQRLEALKEEVIGTATAKCAWLRTDQERSELCVDAASGLPLRKRSSLGLPDEAEYDGYSSAGGKQFPKEIRLTDSGRLVAEFWLDSVSVDLPDQSLFEPLSGAVFRPVCGIKTKAPVPVSTPDPDLHGMKEAQGVVVLRTIIDGQGHTRDVTVVRSLTPTLDRKAKTAVEMWRFRPAMCGGTPVPIETTVTYRFEP